MTSPNPAPSQTPPAPKNWYAEARRLARMLDQAITIPGVALESFKWSHEADRLIRKLGMKPGSSKRLTYGKF